MKRGEGFSSVIKSMGEESRKRKEDWNRDNPPLREVAFEQGEEEVTLGVWINKDKSISFSPRLPNGSYDPYRMINIPKILFDLIIELTVDVEVE